MKITVQVMQSCRQLGHFYRYRIATPQKQKSRITVFLRTDSIVFVQFFRGLLCHSLQMNMAHRCSTIPHNQDPWCCYIWCARDPIIFFPSHVSILMMKILTSTAKRLIRKARITRSKRNARRINTWAGPRGPSYPIPAAFQCRRNKSAQPCSSRFCLAMCNSC